MNVEEKGFEKVWSRYDVIFKVYEIAIGKNKIGDKVLFQNVWCKMLKGNGAGPVFFYVQAKIKEKV